MGIGRPPVYTLGRPGPRSVFIQTTIGISTAQLLYLIDGGQIIYEQL